VPYKHLVAMRQPSKLASGVQFTGGALLRAASYIGEALDS
jgi:hypothetical protein